MQRRISSYLVLVLALFASAGAGCDKLRGGSAEARETGGRRGAPSDRPVTVSVSKVERRDVPIDLEGIGSVIAYKTVTIRAQVDGRLEKVLFNEGDSVKRGQPLAQIDARPFEIQLRQAESALERDRTQANAATLNLERYKKLAEQKFTAQQQTDDQRALVGQYSAAVMADEAQIAAAKLNLSYARIISPIDGVTGVRQVDPGNYLRASDTTGIVVVTQLDPIAALFTLPQDDLPEVMAQMQRGKLAVDAYDRAGTHKLAAGELLLVDNQINQTTATIRLKATFPNPERKLWPNQFVKVRLHLSVEQGALVVPTGAVQRGPTGTFVYLLSADQATVSARPVEIALSLSDVTAIKSGLAPGDSVVVDGQSQLRDGAKVHVAGAKRGAAARDAGTLP